MWKLIDSRSLTKCGQARTKNDEVLRHPKAVTQHLKTK
jgi:hypothetical protein